MDLLIGIVASVVIVLIGFILVPYLKRKGFLNREKAETTKQILQIVQLILENTNFKNEDFNDKKAVVLQVFKISEIAVKYVEQTSKFEDNKTKKRLAFESVVETLTVVGIEITDELEKIIELGIESAVNSLPKTNAR